MGTPAETSALQPPPEEEYHFPVMFGRYTLTRRLGEGGMGEVFLATLKGNIEGVEKPCVIKKLRRNYSGDEEFVGRFLDEARLMVQLSHTNIVPVFDAGSHEGEYYLAMELVDGVDLRGLLDWHAARSSRLPEPVVLYIAKEILGALGYAHRKKDAQGKSLGLVHRDISPQNILLSTSGEVKLIDFGLAKTTQKALKTNPNVVLGKYAYMSPEQARGQPIDGRSDLFAVALLMWEMLSGRKLFDGITVGELMEQIAEHRVFPVSRVAKEVDPELDGLITRALVKDAATRFQTAEQFRDAITPLLHRLGPSVTADDLAREVKLCRGLELTGLLPAPKLEDDTASLDSLDTQPVLGAADAEDSADDLPPALKKRNTDKIRRPSSTSMATASGLIDEPLPALSTPTWKLVLLGLGMGVGIVALGVALWLGVRGGQSVTDAEGAGAAAAGGDAADGGPAGQAAASSGGAGGASGTTAEPKTAETKVEPKTAEKKVEKKSTKKKKPKRKPRRRRRR